MWNAFNCQMVYLSRRSSVRGLYKQGEVRRGREVIVENNRNYPKKLSQKRMSCWFVQFAGSSKKGVTVEGWEEHSSTCDSWRYNVLSLSWTFRQGQWQQKWLPVHIMRTPLTNIAGICPTAAPHCLHWGCDSASGSAVVLSILDFAVASAEQTADPLEWGWRGH